MFRFTIWACQMGNGAKPSLLRTHLTARDGRRGGAGCGGAKRSQCGCAAAKPSRTSTSAAACLRAAPCRGLS